MAEKKELTRNTKSWNKWRSQRSYKNWATDIGLKASKLCTTIWFGFLVIFKQRAMNGNYPVKRGPSPIAHSYTEKCLTSPYYVRAI